MSIAAADVVVVDSSSSPFGTVTLAFSLEPNPPHVREQKSESSSFSLRGLLADMFRLCSLDTRRLDWD